jgi:tRNA dimethylallyltransferase
MLPPPITMQISTPIFSIMDRLHLARDALWSRWAGAARSPDRPSAPRRKSSASYSTGHWLRDVAPLLDGPDRPIIVGGTGLYFTALTEGLADIPATPPALRAEADGMTLAALLAGIDAATATGLDRQNRARVQRAWEVEHATGRPLAAWQAETGPPLLARGQATALAMVADRDWLNRRIETRIDAMLAGGALDEVAAMRAAYDPVLPAFRAIGVPELMAHLAGRIDRDTARTRMIVATRQFAKRQRTWLRARMPDWHAVPLG